MAENTDSNSPVENERRSNDSGLADELYTFETQANYDPTESRDLTTVIIGAIADAEGVSLTEVRSPPLYDVVDVEAVERTLFGRSKTSQDDSVSVVEFRYDDYEIRVESTGWVTVSKRSDGRTVD
ncbi:HalOD1 output domain-containing protein [Salinigranum salinum]|uniref:HalOD1 output domain-containing protein n=1 Tax=Salinigranum salinum TaxID=1364937 RepID=UPI001260784A|nr:HalOD1 output domain-containing protein [Salinigranum salinum]